MANRVNQNLANHVREAVRQFEDRREHLEELIAKETSLRTERAEYLKSILTPMEWASVAMGRFTARGMMAFENGHIVSELKKSVTDKSTLKAMDEKIRSMEETAKECKSNAEHSCAFILGLAKAEMYFLTKGGSIEKVEDPDELLKTSVMTKFGRKECDCENCECELKAMLLTLQNPGMLSMTAAEAQERYQDFFEKEGDKE